jgi:D-3-phosphoglycerate dehydrogenase
MLTLISDAFDASLEEKLKVFGEVTTDKARAPEADIILVRAKTTCNKEYLDSLKNCKLIIRGGVGIDNIDKPYAESKGIIVTNTPKASGIAVAELAFALMISVPDHITMYHNGMKNNEWLKNTKRTELYGKTLAFIGMGNIAYQVAKRAVAFGMNIVAYDVYVDEKKKDIVKFVSTPEEAVENADYISLHVPGMDSTKGMINKELISKMKKKPVIINTSRGAVINADDVKEALDNGSISWYATDVYPTDDPEKLFNMDYPIFKSDKVTLTPHVGANSKENLLRIGDEVISTIQALKDQGKI